MPGHVAGRIWFQLKSPETEAAGPSAASRLVDRQTHAETQRTVTAEGAGFRRTLDLILKDFDYSLDPNPRLVELQALDRTHGFISGRRSLQPVNCLRILAMNEPTRPEESINC